MSKSNLFLLFFIVIMFHVIAGVSLWKFQNFNSELMEPTPPPIHVPPEKVEPPKPQERKPQITETIPQGQLSYDGVNQWLERLSREAPDQTEVGVVGKSSSGREINYIRVGAPNNGPKVLITACVHGNEKLCAAVSLACVSEILKNYMVDEEVTELLRTRQFYYIPVVCPDGYANNSRYEDDLDPNRNWNGRDLSEIRSIPSVQAVKDFHLKHKFNAVMSCHNYGRIYFLPWGYNQTPSKYRNQYEEIMIKMGRESGYNFEQLLRQSAPPYYGYETDWYHKHDAFSIVNEIGINFQARSDEIKSETRGNYKAFLIFIKEGPLVMLSDDDPIRIIRQLELKSHSPFRSRE